MLSCLLLTTSLFAADLDSVSMFRKLDDKVSLQMRNKQWDYASKAFVRILWDDYKQAHENTKPELSAIKIHGKTPDIQDYNQYLGAYTRDKEKTDKVFLEIKKSDKDTFFVELAGYGYPAVATGNSIVFSNGTVEASPTLPRFAAHPYCTLKIFTITRIDGKYFFLSADDPPDKWLEIFKNVEK
jgi:hypothetical protein